MACEAPCFCLITLNTKKQIPVNIITGFLGAGKTTAIIQLLIQKKKAEQWAVLINEFGKERIFFEASNVKSQTELFKEFGKDINLGNIHTNDIILVETIRNSLKSETFFD